MHVHGVYKKPFKSDEMRKTTTFQFHLKLGDNVVPNYLLTVLKYSAEYVL